MLIVGILGCTIACLGGAWRHWVSNAWSESEVRLDLAPVADAQELWRQLEADMPTCGQPVLQHLSWRGWKARIRPGRYHFPAGESVQNSAARLASGQRESVRVVVPSGRDVGPVAGAASRHIWADSAHVAQLFSSDSIQWRVLPNTYEMWWESDGLDLVQRLIREHEDWWTDDRKALAAAHGLSIREATILASIVQAETAQLEEAPRVAGLYLNRLKRGMALQADPTLIFALGDPNIRRVLDIHKDIDSPYNTYLHKGLPPGPIRFVDPRYIQSVLHPAVHNDLYMCAEPGGTGKHRFASSYREHLRNARAYQTWLNRQRIFK